MAEIDVEDRRAAAQLDTQPRLSRLPGPSRLVRLPQAAWDAIAANRASETTLPPEVLQALHRAGFVEDSGMPSADWDLVLRGASRSAVRLDLVAVHGQTAWRTAVHVLGRDLVVVDQVHTVHSRGGQIELGVPSPAVTVGVARLDHLSAVLATLLPLVPALQGAVDGAGSDGAADIPSVDPLAVAQAHLMVTSAPAGRPPLALSTSWYAVGPDGTRLLTLRPGDAPADHPGAATSGGTGAAPAADPVVVHPAELYGLVRAQLASALQHAETAQEEAR
ncbi:hypothetical protein JSY14_07160 [Brachybacterium sp. EF45031]|uniref:hypothetical protein n=1 Tax=Brachybacterium sillae TaxID=2810536 RepID=UPI00217D5104|nr:hypothetical protein [Brachybacterium sillae]MCS6711810.1 hypothetical protein [Brachybacterium sillae]